MRKTVLSALFAVGVVTAAPAAAGINDAADVNSLVHQTVIIVHTGRRCYTRRICYIN